MNILLITDNGNHPLAYRMNKEGAKVHVYVHDKAYYGCYKGIQPRVPLSKLRAAIKQADFVIFTMTRPNRGTREDRALLKMFRVPLRSSTVFGPIADKLKRKYKNKQIIGASAFTEEKMEMDRDAATKIAKDIGLDVPESKKFKSLAEGTKFLKKRSTEMWCFKPCGNMDLDLTYVEQAPGQLLDKFKYEYKDRIGNKVEFILQKKVNGVEISTEGWFNGKDWTMFNHTLESKTFMNDDLGPNLGSATNCVWVKRGQGLLVKELKALTDKLKKAKYVGPVDVNCIVSKHKTWFLEFTPRMTTDAHYCLFSLLRSKISDFLTNGFKGDFLGGMSCGIRLSIPPYPYFDKGLLKCYARGVHIDAAINTLWFEDVMFDKGLRCAGADGIIGVAVATDRDIRDACNKSKAILNKLNIGAYKQYRTDAYSQSFRKLQRLERMVLDVR